jgi:hypothetical protein
LLYILVPLAERVLFLIACLYFIFYCWSINELWLAYACFFLIITVMELVSEYHREFLTRLLFITSIPLLIMFLFYYPNLPSVLFTLGYIFNCLAMIMNRGMMPMVNVVNLDSNSCRRQGVRFPFGFAKWNGIDTDYRHQFTDGNTRLFYLCDWISVRNFSIISIGDVCFLSAGMLALFRF